MSSPATVVLPRGAFVVSVDTELAWGGAHRREGSTLAVGPAASPAAHRYEAERGVIDRLLDLFAGYGITATWAMVGHLFLDQCHDGGRGPHPDVARPAYSWLDGDWLAIDPCTSLAVDPDWYGRDIVDRIVACPVRQEIGSHSFSHVIVDDPACTPEVFSSELAASAKLAAERGLDLRSFVYPRNAIAQVERLGEHGFRCYRGGRPSSPFAGRPAWSRRVLAAVDKVRPLAGSAVLPTRHESGVWNVPQTYLFAPPRGVGRPVLWVRRPIARLRQAARHRSLFHLWFHPYNITSDPGPALAALDRVCAAAAKLHDAGRLDVLSMGALAERLDAG